MTDYRGESPSGGGSRSGRVALLRILACALLCIRVAWGAGAEAPEAPRRPKVCLVLSGGGALGLAHVGVLRVLEELRIPVDCIAGTSMGSIVGAAYASGMTPDEMERRLRATDWDLVFRDAPPRTEQSVLRKQLDAMGLWGLELGLSRGLPVLPKGALAGQQLLATLRSFVHEPPGGNFDRLPIPFRAVATDIESGEAVILSRGDLARALRASMSVPGLVSPEEIENHILLDGGLVRNLPVDVARAMGADVVIAVNLGTKLLKRNDLESVLGVSVQMINILTEQNVRRSLLEIRPEDVLIEPDLAGFSAVSFGQAGEIIPRGTAAARKHLAELTRLSLPAEEYEQIRLDQTGALRAARPPTRMEVDTSGLRFVNPAAVQAAIRTRQGAIPGEEELAGNVARLYGRGDLDRIDYRFADRNGTRTLVVETREKARGPDYLRLGVALSTDLQGDGRFSLQLFFNRTWINSLGAQWRTRVQVGVNESLSSEFYQPLDLRGWLFVAPRVEFAERYYDLYVDKSPIAEYRVRQAGVGLDVGANLDKWGEIRVGVYRGVSSATPSIAMTFFPSERADVGNIGLRALYDQLDNVNFPTAGAQVQAALTRSAHFLGATYDYSRFDLNVTQAVGSRAHSAQISLRGGRALSGDLPFHDLYVLGGLFSLSGYPIGSLIGEAYVLGRVTYYHRLTRIPALAEGLFWGVSLEAGNMYHRLDSRSGEGNALKGAGALFVAADTAIGPVYLAWGHAAGGWDALYIMLGRP